MLREDPTSVVYARVHTSNMKFDDPAMEPAPGPTSASGWHLAEPVTLSRTYEPTDEYHRKEPHVGFTATLTGKKYSVAFRLNQPDCVW